MKAKVNLRAEKYVIENSPSAFTFLGGRGTLAEGLQLCVCMGTFLGEEMFSVMGRPCSTSVFLW